MDGSDFNTAYEYPYYVHDDRQAAPVIWAGLDLAAERPQSKDTHLHELESERYAYDGHTEHKTDKEIVQGYYKAAQDEPEDVPDEFHDIVRFIFLKKLPQVQGHRVCRYPAISVPEPGPRKEDTSEQPTDKNQL